MTLCCCALCRGDVTELVAEDTGMLLRAELRGCRGRPGFSPVCGRAPLALAGACRLAMGSVALLLLPGRLFGLAAAVLGGARTLPLGLFAGSVEAPEGIGCGMGMSVAHKASGTTMGTKSDELVFAMLLLVENTALWHCRGTALRIRAAKAQS
mmetsp:Transcript_9863/g.21688  ORF Transcript_9863/g.21688 Transcript_9863/m.21688 type:complete len:153 (-) Transcript_9863:368-826(-)